jgi:hypothetical protein
MWPGHLTLLLFGLHNARTADPGHVGSGNDDDLSPARTLPFSLRVIVLTMNRPQSLGRLLDSLSRTFFEDPADSLHVEIHVDKAHGKQLINMILL